MMWKNIQKKEYFLNIRETSFIGGGKKKKQPPSTIINCKAPVKNNTHSSAAKTKWYRRQRSLECKQQARGLPWWLIKKSACQYRRRGFDPWSRKIPHALKQLSLCTPNYWACALEPMPQLLTPKGHRAPAPQWEATTTESPFTASRGQPLLATVREKSHGNEASA